MCVLLMTLCSPRVTSVAFADLAQVVIIMGVANLVADGISMGMGDFVSTTAENEQTLAERKREEWEYDNYREGEVTEMVELYVKKGAATFHARLSRSGDAGCVRFCREVSLSILSFAGCSCLHASPARCGGRGLERRGWLMLVQFWLLPAVFLSGNAVLALGLPFAICGACVLYAPHPR